MSEITLFGIHKLYLLLFIIILLCDEGERLSLTR